MTDLLVQYETPYIARAGNSIGDGTRPNHEISTSNTVILV